MAQLNNHSQEMDALNATHTAQQNSLNASHKSQLAAVVAELESKHRAELVALEATLHSKRKEDLERLEAVFQETNQVQLEALEAELSRKHQEETDELEKRMLGNMDTLEATYLKEVQVSLRKRPKETFFDWFSSLCSFWLLYKIFFRHFEMISFNSRRSINKSLLSRMQNTKIFWSNLLENSCPSERNCGKSWLSFTWKSLKPWQQSSASFRR